MTPSTTRTLAIEGLLNMRDLGGLSTPDGRVVRPGRVLRSDNLGGLTEAGTDRLMAQLDPRLVVDLRTAVECTREGRGLAGVDRVRYENLVLTPKGAITPEQVAQGLATTLIDDYLLQVRDNAGVLVQVLTLLAEPGSLPAVVHCTACKDRTGITAALLLELLGVERKQVVADYAETTANMPGILARIRATPFFHDTGLAQAPSWIFGSEAATMSALLAHLDIEHGGTLGWALEAGMDPDVPHRLRHAMLVA